MTSSGIRMVNPSVIANTSRGVITLNPIVTKKLAFETIALLLGILGILNRFFVS